MDIIKEDVVFYNNKKTKIAGRIYKNSLDSLKGVIFSHGLFSSKDGYKITRLAEDIVSEGFTLLAFDFSFSGESGGKISDLSILQEVQDLGCAVRFMIDTGMKEIHLIGSSMGGAVSLIYLSEKPALIKSLSLIATPVDLHKLLILNTGIRDIEGLPHEGYTKIDEFEIKNSFFKEALEINIHENLKKIKTPVLVIHGENDSVVGPEDAGTIIDLLDTDKKLVIIEKGDHNLTTENDISVIRENIISWLNTYN